MDKIVMTEKELAEELGLSPWTVRRLRLQEGCPHFWCGKRVLYRLETVLAWISSKESSGQQEKPQEYGVVRPIL